jgi:hypothetical protein
MAFTQAYITVRNSTGIPVAQLINPPTLPSSHPELAGIRLVDQSPSTSSRLSRGPAAFNSQDQHPRSAAVRAFPA